MFNKLTIKDVTVRKQNVLVRVDYNVPIKDGKIVDDLRIRESLPTLELLRKKGARRIILISHLGRPNGEKVLELSLGPIAKHLATLLPDAKVSFINDVSGPDVEEAVEKTPVGGILVLENLRFYPGEEQNSSDFAREIAESTHADLFVQDGFAVVHRAHASTSAITTEVPSIAGLLVEKEYENLSKITQNPAHPFTVIIGGAKVEDKQPLIDVFAKSADHIIVGGKIAADGFKSKLKNVYVAEDFTTDDAGQKLDIGEKSIVHISEILQNSKTILWNGALGKVEDPQFAHGSKVVAEVIGANKNTSVICGGDTTGFVHQVLKENQKLKYTLISTGGGAALELLSGLPLPGIDALDDR